MTSNRVKIEEWRITVSEGVIDAIHGGGHKITEFYIPEKEIAFSVDGVTLEAHVFRTKKSQRYEWKSDGYFHQPPPEKVGDRFVSKKFVDFLEKYLKLKDSLFAECAKEIGAMK